MQKIHTGSGGGEEILFSKSFRTREVKRSSWRSTLPNNTPESDLDSQSSTIP